MRIRTKLVGAGLAIWLLVLPDAQTAFGQVPADELPAAFTGGAELKTNPEHQQLLAQAARSLAAGRADLAAVLWQRVLDEAADGLTPAQVIEPLGPTSSPLVVYAPLAELVERTIVESGRAALAAYRTTADAEARAILAAVPPHDERALAEVVRRFFLSSVGDDAAFALASLALDRHDFVAAFGLIEKTIRHHPDYSLAKSELLARLAVAAAHMGDQEAAEQALFEMKELASQQPADERVALVAAEIELLRSLGRSAAVDSRTEGRSWRMPYGNAARTGHMPALPAKATEGTLAEQWSQDFPLASLAASPGSGGPSGYLALDPFERSENTQGRQAAAVQSQKEMIARWRAGGWRPTGGLLFVDDRMYYKAPDRVVCFPADQPGEQPLWQSAWQNRYELDATARFLALINMRIADGAPRSGNQRPASMAEILLFGDRVHASLAAANSELLAIEGKRLTAAATRPEQRPFALNNTPRRARSNWLTAYQATGGKAVWTRSAGEEGAAGAEAGFLAAPTPCSGHFVVPVTDGGTLWLHGLQAETGRTLWKTYLCDEPQGGASPWAAPLVAVEGREVYLAAGCGLVFAVDGASGAIRWAVRYPRDVKPSVDMRQMFGLETPHLMDYHGWDDDVVIPFGRLLLVMASDADRILALDRRTGERAWEAPRTSPFGTAAEYCLGVRNDCLFVAGRNVVRRYEIATGRLLAEQRFDDSFGRGCLTENAVLLPVGTAVETFGLDLQRRSSVAIVLSTEEPVGNLFSDGRRLWGVGAGRIYALTTLSERLAVLHERIEAGDADAQLERMRLYLKDGRLQAAAADLRGAFGRLQRQLTADEAARRLLATIIEQRLPKEEPALVLRLLHEMFVDRSSGRLSISEAVQPGLAEVVATCVNAIRQSKPPGGVSELVAGAPLLTEEYLQTAASFAIDALAQRSDAPLLLQAIARGPAAAQLVTMRAAARIAPAESRLALAGVLPAGDERVRLAAARTLANLGERRGVLETLASLLNSDSAPVRTRSYQTLQGLTGQRIPFAPEGTATDRAAGVAAWRRWVAESGATARLNLPLADRAARLSRMLLVTPDAILELDGERKERWRTQVAGAAWGCQGLANGHRLVAINSHSAVVEFDDGGQEVWKKDRLPGPPTSVQRLENGNTLVACPSAGAIVEILPDGRTSSLEVAGSPTWAERLDSGGTLVAIEKPLQRVIEIDSSGRIVWEARTGGQPPVHATRLENGNTLVTLSKGRQVIELDPTGQTIVWRSQVPLLFPMAAQRLASGNTLVADQTGVREIDPSGREVKWQLRVMQVMGLAAF